MPGASKEGKYQPLATRAEGSDDDSELADAGASPRHSQSRRSRSYFILIGGLVLISNLLSCFIGAYMSMKNNSDQAFDLDEQCSWYTSKYSPVLKDVKIEYSDRDFNGTFLLEDIYRRPASPEVDAAWEALGVDYRPGFIPLEEGPMSGLGPRHVQRSAEHGGGYIVNVEGMHHLHCLNLVRKSLYYNYEYYKALGTHAFKNDDHILRLHTSHCLDTIRQVLMCNVETSVLGQVWVKPEHPITFPDFNTRHKCKNFEAVRDWAEKLQAPPPETLPPGYLKAADPKFILLATP